MTTIKITYNLLRRENEARKLSVDKRARTLGPNAKISFGQTGPCEIAGNQPSIGKISLMKMRTAKVTAKENSILEIGTGQLLVAKVLQDRLGAAIVFPRHRISETS